MKVRLFAMLSTAWSAITFGQAVKASSLPVVIASDQMGAAAKASALPVTMATDQPAIKVRGVGEFETVAASQTDQVLGASGAAGDILERLVIVPANVNPGVVQIKDGAGSAITIFAGGTASIAVLNAIVVDIGIVSASGAWKVTTGADVSVIAVGDFT